jgi:hypothetical protein
LLAVGRRTPLWSALIDATFTLRGRIRTWFARLDSNEILLGVSGSALVVLVPIQLLRRKKTRSKGAGDGDTAVGEALRCIERLFGALAERGAVRRASESLESFARRLDELTEVPRGADELLLRYAALRYGGIGDPTTLTRDVDDWIASAERRAA